jgi:hypothetical protein
VRGRPAGAKEMGNADLLDETRGFLPSLGGADRRDHDQRRRIQQEFCRLTRSWRPTSPIP